MLSCAPVAGIARADADIGALMSKAMEAIDRQDFDTAGALAAQTGDPVAGDLVEWARLRKSGGHLDDYLRFLDKHGDWPGLKLLRRAGESVIPPGGDPDKVLRYFAGEPPQTGTGSLRLTEALQAQGKDDAARAEAIRAWREMPLIASEEDVLLSRFGKTLAPHYQERADTALWNGWTTAAERMLPRLTDAQARLVKARIALQRMDKGVDARIEAVPRSLAGDPGLAFDRFMWRVRKERWEDAAALLLQRSGSAEELGRPEEWSNRRRGFARQAMRDGDPNTAYLLASQHGLTEGSDYADLEWLSGYIALKYLASPEQALVHFTNFWAAVNSPISLGRAGYWLGRAYEALGNGEKAEEAYRFGARYQTSFYGQLAAARIGTSADPSLAGRSSVPSWRKAEFIRSGPIRAALLLGAADQLPMMRWFFSHVAETQNETGLLQLAQMALDLGQPHVALGVAKEAAKRGIVLPAGYFPVTDLARYAVDVDPEVALSVARRESELNDGAVSPAGAQGLMQIMPSTARHVSKDLGVTYSKARLTTDWRYNAKLASAYLNGLLTRYDGSYLLAFAAYNAGPARVSDWIEANGDPRDPGVDSVDWIEHIPYRETRDYVMRVMESLHVYRARLSGRAQPLRILRDLSRG